MIPMVVSAGAGSVGNDGVRKVASNELDNAHSVCPKQCRPRTSMTGQKRPTGSPLAQQIGCKPGSRVPRFAEPFRHQWRENAERLAAEADIEIEFVRKRNFRKEGRMKGVLARCGEHPGLALRAVGHGALLNR
jgi:hypothetical protein